MTADSMVVKEMIEQHLQHLRSELQQHGLEIGKFEVQVGNGNENWKSGQENAGFRQAMQQKRSNARFNRQDRGRQNPIHATPTVLVSGAGSGEIDYFV
jgi:flagellar hook-length control protein FliK